MKMRTVVGHDFFWDTDTGEDVLHIGTHAVAVVLFM